MENKRPAGTRRAGRRGILRASSSPAPGREQALDARGLEALALNLMAERRTADGGYLCRCPCHDDRHASLSLALGEGGRLLVHCHRGCPQTEVFRAVLTRARELGLMPAPTKTGRPKAAKVAAKKPLAKSAEAAPPPAGARATKRRRSWPAFDAKTGEHVADHVREDGPSGGKRVWWSRRGVRTADLALYRFQKLAELPDRPAVICEGEVATDALAELEDVLGAVALGTQTGASGTPGDAALEPLRGRVVYLWPDNDPPGRAHMSRLAGRLAALGVEDIRLINWPDAPEKGDAADAVAVGVDVAGLLEAARRWEPEREDATEEATTAVEPEPDADTRPKVRINKGDPNRTARKVAEMIRERLFLLGGRLPVVAQKIAKKRKIGLHGQAPAGTLFVETAEIELVAALADATCRFFKFDARSDDWVQISCPQSLARRVLSGLREIGEPFDHLVGVARVPLLREDGTLVAGGYDAETEVYVDCLPLDGVPAAPTGKDAERALERLLRPFRGYDLDRNAELQACIFGAALTAVVRPSVPTSPAVLLDGNQPGVGKGLLARALAALATGTALPVIIGEGHSPEELGKTLDAVLMHAPDVVILDNLSRPLQCSRLEQFLTEGTATLRPLGVSKIVTVTPRIFVLITANNAAIRTDTQRRMLPIRLVVLDERPELRRFDFDPVEEVLRGREELLRAAFTVLRWWQDQLRRGADWPELGSFREWSRLVAGAVRALTGIDLPALIAARRHDDPATAAERALFATLAKRFGEQPFKAVDAIATLPAELWGDLNLRCGSEGKPDARTLTAWLRRRKDAVRGAFALRSSLDKDRVALWRLEPLKQGGPGPAPTDSAEAEKRNFRNYPTPTREIVREGIEKNEGVTVSEAGRAHSREFRFSAAPSDTSAPANTLLCNGNRADDALADRVAALLAAGELGAAEAELNAVGAFPGPRTLRDLAAMRDATTIRTELAALLGGGA